MSDFAKKCREAAIAERKRLGSQALTGEQWDAVINEVFEREAGKRPSNRNTSISTPNAACLRIYAAYPRKIGRNAAFRAIQKALASVSEEVLLSAVNRFKWATDRWSREDRAFISHPATWFNEGRWEDDPAEWDRGKCAPRTPAEKPEPINEPKGWQEWARTHIPEWVRLEAGMPIWDILRPDEQAMIVKQMGAK